MYDKFYDVVLPQPELWEPIDGYELCYQVSNYGQVKSLSRSVPWVDRNGRCGVKNVSERILKPKTDKDGYHEYCLSQDGTRTYKRGHRLVAETFFSREDQADYVVDHKDAIKIHNTVYNLQWLTAEENTIKYYSQEYGKNKSLSSLSREEWLVIGELYQDGVEYKDICTQLGIDAESPQTLWEGLSGRRLSSVTGFKKGDYQKRNHPCTKLNEDDVLEILYKRLVEKLPLKVISREYNVADSVVSRISKGTRHQEVYAKFIGQQGEIT